MRRSQCCCGRDFSYGLLHDVAGITDAALEAGLERLAEADILLVQGVPPLSEYRFNGALIQDSAYENLLKSRRQVLHRRVAEALREEFAKSGRVEPELLAHHFTQAGLTESGRRMVGQGGTAVTGTLGVGRGHRAIHARPRPDRNLARHACAAPRAHQTSSRGGHAPSSMLRVTPHWRQRPPSGAGAAADRTSSNHSEKHRKTRCCCFQSSTASGLQASSLSMAIRCASLRRSS